MIWINKRSIFQIFKIGVVTFLIISFSIIVISSHYYYDHHNHGNGGNGNGNGNGNGCLTTLTSLGLLGFEQEWKERLRRTVGSSNGNDDDNDHHGDD